MKYLLLPLRVIYKIYYLTYFVLSFLICYPIFYYLLASRSRFLKAFILMRWYALVWQFFAFSPVRVRAVSNIPCNGSFIICANHSSYMDIPVMYCVFKRYFVSVGKKEIEKWPLFHIFYTSEMNIAVDRDSPSASFDAFKRMLTEIDKGNPLAIFPEGTIPKHAPKLGDFKSGAFSIAIRKQIPILPVTFVTNWKRLQRSGVWEGKAGPGFSEVVIHEIVDTTGLTKKDTDDLQIRVKKIINRPLKERFGCEV
ncbi:1-acyl-sn-glycerol-3-phosphate acyltransferase [bacterium]|nr:MAG: 1-acyl-sn-glycerol-3-phosphate acyltransferase [bacterium]